jgi:hypothetical protein
LSVAAPVTSATTSSSAKDAPTDVATAAAPRNLMSGNGVIVAVLAVAVGIII